MMVLIFANGELSSGEWIESYLKKATTVIAADGGVDHILALERMPDVVIGDLDSMAPEATAMLRRTRVQILAHAELKDESDLELALRYAVDRDDGEIIVLGALGGRLDQLLANVFLLTAPFLRGHAVRIVDAFQEAWVMGKGKGQVRGEIGDRVSLLPLGGDVHVRRTEGLAWSLTDEQLVYGISRGVSNRLTAQTAMIEIKSGLLLCVHLAAAWQR